MSAVSFSPSVAAECAAEFTSEVLERAVVASQFRERPMLKSIRGEEREALVAKVQRALPIPPGIMEAMRALDGEHPFFHQSTGAELDLLAMKAYADGDLNESEAGSATLLKRCIECIQEQGDGTCEVLSCTDEAARSIFERVFTWGDSFYGNFWVSLDQQMPLNAQRFIHVSFTVPGDMPSNKDILLTIVLVATQNGLGIGNRTTNNLDPSKMAQLEARVLQLHHLSPEEIAKGIQEDLQGSTIKIDLVFPTLQLLQTMLIERFGQQAVQIRPTFAFMQRPPHSGLSTRVLTYPTHHVTLPDTVHTVKALTYAKIGFVVHELYHIITLSANSQKEQYKSLRKYLANSKEEPLLTAEQNEDLIELDAPAYLKVDQLREQMNMSFFFFPLMLPTPKQIFMAAIGQVTSLPENIPSNLNNQKQKIRTFLATHRDIVNPPITDYDIDTALPQKRTSAAVEHKEDEADDAISASASTQ